MRMSRLPLLLFMVGALALCGCVRGQQAASVEPVTAAQAPVVYSADAPASRPRGFFAYNLGGPFTQATPATAPTAPCPASGCGPASLYAAAYPGGFEEPYLLDAC